MLSRSAPPRRTGARVAAALAVATVAACSSAPAPDTLSASGTGDGAGTAVVDDPATPQDEAAVDAVTGQPPAAAVGGASAPAGGAAGGGAAAGTPAGGGPTAGGSAGGGGGGGGGGGTTAAAPARSTLFSGKEDTIGITPTSITMCAHAALTYGAAFNTTHEDFNVYWSAVNDAGGIHGRKVSVTYENDNYQPGPAVEAARACKAKNPFLLIGGIGFDQIPAVRNYVEEQRMLYLHHTATVKGSQGLKYSFTGLPTVERTGEAFAQLYLQKFKGKKLGIIKRDGENWEPGVQAFKAYLRARGVSPVVAETKVPQNKGNYTDDILAMKNGGAQVVWLWENALASTQVVKQMKAQRYSPNLMLFPFNLTSQTLGDDAMNPPMDGVAMFSAFSKGDYSGPFAAYADDVRLFEQQYRKYRPRADLNGVGGDLLFLNWQAQKALHDILLACGKDCTRNRFVDTITGYKKRPTSSVCPLDFTRGDRRHGADQLTFMQTYRSPSGKVNWRNTVHCVGPA
ncbi:MAG TPA: ABC transporter substrate-binding protein [Mycobacteriales bacterium]|nr:ABC transporter substrate-binding protein [Mycobacteriales bacterium]